MYTARNKVYLKSIYSPLHALVQGARGSVPLPADVHGLLRAHMANRGDGLTHIVWSRQSAVSTASGILANVFPSAMADVVDPPRCIATVRLPCQVCIPHAAVPDIRTYVLDASQGLFYCSTKGVERCRYQGRGSCAEYENELVHKFNHVERTQ